MTAKKMFEELGYKCDEKENIISYHLNQIVNKYDNNYGIVFNLKYNSYHTYCYGWFDDGRPYDSNLCIDMQLHKAINKQIEELRWSNE